MVATRSQSESLSVSDSPYPLLIETIPVQERILPEFECRLIHPEAGLQVPGQFTQEEAKLIQAVTQDWNWQVDKHNKPACATRLLWYLEQLCKHTSDIKEVEP